MILIIFMAIIFRRSINFIYKINQNSTVKKWTELVKKGIIQYNVDRLYLEQSDDYS